MNTSHRIHHIKRKQLSERWSEQTRFLSGSSPFGTTVAGLQDFQAFSFPDVAGTLKTSIVSVPFKDVDLSYSDLNNIVVKNCTFENCLFAYTNLQNVIFEKCKFSKCFFPYTDFRAAGVGIRRGEFDSCEFVCPKLARVSFHFVVFKNIDFDGKAWSFVNFGIADFWNCTLRGLFSNCQFQDPLWEDESVKLATPKGLGFHNVDLSAAEFFFSRFPPNWVMDDVQMSRNQSWKYVKVNDLKLVLKFYPEESQHNFILSKYLAIFVHDAPGDQLCIVSKYDLLDLGDPKAASEVFTRI